MNKREKAIYCAMLLLLAYTVTQFREYSMYTIYYYHIYSMTIFAIIYYSH